MYIFEETNQILISDRQHGLFLFSFPIQILNTTNYGTFVSSAHFLDENGFLIPRDYLNEKELYFSIYTVNGQLIYEQENYLNYVQIPLSIAAGTYIFSIYNQFEDRVESGKFIKGN